MGEDNDRIATGRRAAAHLWSSPFWAWTGGSEGSDSRVELFLLDGRLQMEAPISGAGPDDISVTVTPSQVVLEVRGGDAGPRRIEVALPYPVDPATAHADLQDDRLSVEMEWAGGQDGPRRTVPVAMGGQ